ncbi:MAG: thioredoxin [Rhizobiales bacterium]|nr:thioredoxin [Hyphomicrobiales bacterium]
MLIVCPNCATSYQVEPSSLGATGRSVRCVRCRKVWFAANPAAMAEIALSHHQDVAALSGAAPDGGRPATDGLRAAAAPEGPPDSSFDQAPPSEGLVRDDRGPAPLPEPRSYEVPPDPLAIIDNAPALVPNSDGTHAAADTIREDIESVAARRTGRQATQHRPRWPIPGWAAAILLLIVIDVGLIGWRADIVRLMPQTAVAYAAIGLEVNLRGLVFTELVTREETQDGVPTLVLEGVIKSTSKRDTAVPRLRFAVRNAQGHEIYSWTALPEHAVIAPGASMPFRSRLASPPPEAHAVLVRFLHRRDLIAGLQ